MHTHTHSLCLRAPQNSISMCALTYYCESYGACLCVFVSIVNYLIVHNWIERTKKKPTAKQTKTRTFHFCFIRSNDKWKLHLLHSHTLCERRIDTIILWMNSTGQHILFGFLHSSHTRIFFVVFFVYFFWLLLMMRREHHRCLCLCVKYIWTKKIELKNSDK